VKVDIQMDGKLRITAENETEAFALHHWRQKAIDMTPRGVDAPLLYTESSIFICRNFTTYTPKEKS